MTTDVSPEGLYFPTDITPEQLFRAMGKLRRAAKDEIERLLTFLDSTEPDADLEPDLAGYDRGMDDREGDDSDYEPDTHDEPSLGFSTGGHYPENQMQDGPGFYMNADSGCGLEDEHDGAEPDVDLERNLGWANEGAQLGTWYGDHSEQETGSPEWPAQPAKWQPPTKRRKVAKPLPTISIKDCERVSA